MNVQKTESYLIVGAAIFAAYAGYRVYKTGQSAADSVANTVSNTLKGIEDTYNIAKNSVSGAYAEIKSTISGAPMYSPAALDASYSRADAMTLAKSNLRRYEILQENYDQKTLDAQTAMQAETYNEYGYVTP